MAGSENESNGSTHPIQHLNIDSKYYDIDNLCSLTTATHSTFQCSAMHINVHSLPAKFDQLNLLLTQLNQHKIDLHFILLCETFLRDSNSSLFNIPGYAFVYKNRKSLSRGGVALYIRNDLKFKIRPDIEINVEGEFESIVVEIIRNSTNTLVGQIYRVPNTNETQSIDRHRTIIDKITNLKIDCILATNQNFNLLNINTHKNTAELFNTFIEATLIPVITRPTRVVHTSSTLIDNIYTNLVIYNTAIQSALLTYGISDHFPILMLAHKSTKPKSTPLLFQCRPTDQKTLENIQAHLQDIDWNCLTSLTPNKSYQKFHSLLNSVISTCTPIKTIRIPQNRIFFY